MKQNKFIQFIAILFSAVIQIGIFLLLLTNIRMSEPAYFDTSILIPILQSYGLVALGVIIIGGLIYGGYYVKKYKQSWMIYLRENILNPIHLSIVIGCIIQAINFCMLFISSIFLIAQSEKFRPQLGLLLITSFLTGLITVFLCLILEACFYENDQTYLLYKGD